MSRGARVRLVLFLTMLSMLLVLPSAHAYVDPGSTSVIFQALIAGLAAVGTGFAVFWSRIRSFFSRGGGGDFDGPSDEQL